MESPGLSLRTEPWRSHSGRLRWKGEEGSRDVTLGLWGMWGLDAVGLYQPQVPGQEEELQELRDRSAGPVHGKFQCPPQAPPHPDPRGNLRFNPALISKIISLLLGTENPCPIHHQLQPQKLWPLPFSCRSPTQLPPQGTIPPPYSPLPTRWRRCTPSWITSWAAARSTSR